MIDFACKRFNIDDIVKCGLGLTAAEYQVMQYFIKHSDGDCSTQSVSSKLGLNLTTIQKAVKKLHEAGVIQRNQINLKGGGYEFVYNVRSKSEIRSIIKKVINNWTERVDEKLDEW
ncbi:winged helix-turn-helix transcriptional regulator [Candidatus Woesearchaeota archaeon]|nr:winged helix-turn-helix transcriptional regulator [Candidatus Woesearchaeota archaeon]